MLSSFMNAVSCAGIRQAANILKRLSSTATTGTETLSTMGSLRNALTAGSTDFSASGLVSLGSGQVAGGFDQVAFYQHLVVSSSTLYTPRFSAFGYAPAVSIWG